MTEKELTAIERRCQATPEGPWLVELVEHDLFFVAKHIKTAPTINRKFYPNEVAQRTPEFDVTDECGYVIHNPNMVCGVSAGEIAKLNFIAYAREDVPKLIAEIRELRTKFAERNTSK
jgi:hypothetical protein